MISQTVRYLYAIRHAEREDNINRNWRPAPGDKADNPPLSATGRRQAEDLRAYFKDKEVSAIFVSPFDRAVETAETLIGDKNIKIFVEPGLCESLVLCESPPGFRTVEELAKRFPKIDQAYRPVLSPPLPQEPMRFDRCDERVEQTITQLREKYGGNLVMVGHDSSVASIIWSLAHQDVYPGQATITVFKDNGGDVQITDKCSVHANREKTKQNGEAGRSKIRHLILGRGHKTGPHKHANLEG
ncbi:unnamed protein product [Bursaphelenchus okinawaensis]|uniref:Phosphoglycerate mutase n=1 Tax=Bursaphelenchus okinawaensis TaxID=465554 RepID=A0A811KN31_9BILA|nr:unnamed protein product [Bursaphelenchus okinawaensis]CAG9106008.1 unnamed protein product [Bursaphelenchus okinawaensis]